MFRGIYVAALLLAAQPAAAQQAQQTLVDRAALAVQEIMTTGDHTREQQDTLKRARAALVCPRVFRAGFILAGEGGTCVLLGRDGGGSWSSPAFYQMSSGSLGLQAGIQDGTMLVMVMTDRGLQALMNSQFKVGADAAMTFATLGAGVQGATTAAAGADIVAISRTRGLFAGMSLQGSLLTYLPDYARAYYGKDASARQIVVQMEAHNPGADPLRAMLMRFGSPGAQASAQATSPTSQR
ncbi:lipid-binding SYLF domain-containing protein [Roseomonas sp. AR75]|jgi:lipid-binding SYLF domain-containing protein|uniref:lipid-binding SYLF domain-containing protein n=1 Tax=Roseomonas sp. AR75 TaxID=2562311 RepID=UPI0010C00ACD|nr:lipid-binding SYLF domain-containing protein [Roseomonas sp. AR75]